ncbi:putative ubiquitinyl hydrolase 1 transcription factor C2H2 family [Lupinus albus]|uniref:Putative ubiquitinyl hydrolase 1 transcription factor C2H2 family n=1 Tax=Lupinus albus TaxID=3870 RepID=A0A6A4PLY6_LUPAL|nr:putative ubiquitinyl hydrolase 1 transcription factor C2H2 family [Lupinus albus]
MGNKKRNPPRSKHSTAASPVTQSAIGGAADVPVSPDSDSCMVVVSDLALNNPSNKVELSLRTEGSVYSSIKVECDKALNAFRRGNHNRALKMMKDLCYKHEGSVYAGFTQRVQGFVLYKVSSIMNDPVVKQRHLKNAVDSARKATELSPNSIEFSMFYGNLLLEAATEAKDYEDVVQECERALAVQNPNDPAKESLQDESEHKSSTEESRIAHVQSELRQLIQKSNIASLSTWMKTLGNGEERFRLIPIRRPAEDPMEMRLVQNRRPNEIKKVSKSPEERRKEIEVRVAAARLLQQKSESPQSPNEADREDRELDSASGSGHRIGDRRSKYGNARKNGSTDERRNWVHSYWNSLSLEMKKELLRIRISDLKSHFGSSKDTLPIDVLSEALSYVEFSKTWKFWLCSECDEKHSNPESHRQHVMQEHMRNLLPKMQRLLPQNVDNEWIDMILNCSWKPLDVSAAIRMLDNKSKLKVSPFTEDSYFGPHTHKYAHTQNFNDCFKDASDSYHEKESLRYDLHNGTTKVSDYCEIAGGNVTEGLEDQGSITYPCADNWPVSDDSERAKLLEKIHVVFEMLIRHKFLAATHLKKVIQFTMGEIQGLSSGSQLVNRGVDQTPMCICFLGASQLKKILQFLQELSQACGLGRYPDKSNGPMNDSHNISQVPEIKEKIVLNGDSSCLLLDECLLLTQVTLGTAQGFFLDDVTSPGSPDGISSNKDAFLSWIFSSSHVGDQLTSWIRTKEDKKNQGKEIVEMLEKEFLQLQGLCEKKFGRISYEEALQTVENLCLEEGKKREHGGEFVQRSYESVLRKRREELTETENDVAYVSNRFELDAISNVLQEAEAMNVNQFGYEETYAGVNSQLCDLESGEEDWRMKDYLHQMDGCIEIAIQKLKEHLSIELSKIDARIIKNVTDMQQMELKLGPISAYDYRAILLPLVKSYLRAVLEDLAEKDATEKSDAAREAFLAELALDSKKVKGGSENTRHLDKTRDKKKNKDHRKTRDFKATSGNEQLLHRDTIPYSNPVAPDIDFQDVVVTVNANDLEQQEEEFKRKIELEEEEKKLEETLEFQRRIENEAKQKHLAEQQKKSSGIYLEEVVDKLQDAQLEAVADGPDVLEHLRPHTQEQLAKENGFPSNLDSVLITPANGSLGEDKSADSTSQKIGYLHATKVKQDLPNGVVSENGLQLTDRRQGKKNRRHKNSSRMVDGKFEPVSSEKEKTENTDTNNHLREQIKSHNNQDASNAWENNGSNALKELKMKDEEEERFQADLKRAVRQSLDTYQAHIKMPPVSGLRMFEIASSQVDSSDFVPEGVPTKDVSGGAPLLGSGLKNEVGEYNCFLNVIIQSLWHIRRFREEFLGRSRSEHDHVGNPCVVCALYEIFTALNLASKDSSTEAVAPTSLRMALSNLYPDSNFFQEAQMNDASEVLAVIFDCLHRSFTRGSSVSDAESVESNCMGSWDCANRTCIAHSLFGMDIFEQMNCYHCGLESRHLKYTSFFHNINANALRTMKDMCSETESSFDELLNLVEMNHQLACDLEVGGCGKLNYIHHFLSAQPHVFMTGDSVDVITVLGWQNTCESADDIKGTLAALSIELDISVLYRGLDPKSTHSLVSMVCYYGQHYHCFAYSHDHQQWIMYDDKTVKIIGGWADVLTMCERGHLQPQVLFYEAVN